MTGKSELHLISENQEIAIGEQNYKYMQQAEGGDLTIDPQLSDYVEKVGHTLAKESDRPHLPYEFVILNNSIPNAWALPGGKIAINRGLLLELHSEAELAAVLAHEIVHSAARHGAKSMERAVFVSAGIIGLDQLLKDHKYENVAIEGAAIGAGLIYLKYSRNAELEADHYGIKYMVKAGYDPQAAITLQETFLKLSKENHSNWLEGLFSTHPPTQERLEANEALVASYPKGGKVGIIEYETALAYLKKVEPAYKKLDDGYKALLEKQPNLALELSEEGIKIEPKEAHLYNLKAKAEILLKNYQQALEDLNEAIALNPNYFDFYLQRGKLYEKLGNQQAARADLDRSQVLLPSADAHYLLGMLDLKAGRKQEALAHFKKAGQVNSPIGQQARRQAALIDINSRK